MKINRALSFRTAPMAIGASLAVLVFAAGAQAATVTVGASFSGESLPGLCGSATGCGVLSVEAEAPSTAAVSPFDGTVTRWRIGMANEVHGFSLNVLRKNPNGAYTVTASSAEVTPPSGSEEVDTFPTDLPIRAGEFVELNVPNGGHFGVFKRPSTIAGFFPALMPGETRAPGGGEGPAEGPSPATLGYNADIEYTPAPPVLLPIPLPVPSAPVAAPHCVVPALRGEKLGAAKKKIRAAGCKLGLLSKRSGVGTQAARVVKQSPKPGKVLPLRTGVSLKLG